MLALVNLGDSKEELRRLRALVPATYDISQEDGESSKDSDEDVFALRDEIREVWAELEKERNHEGLTGQFGHPRVVFILNKWCKHYPLDSYGYFVNYATGTFFPTQANFRGLIARIIANKSRYLAICPKCKQRFIKRRDDQKNCLSASCQAEANNERQTRFQNKKKSAHKSRGRA